ncbi:MAG: hypothetical protein ACD_62C00600G0006 [uncultured bacterium]|nr:MAG: hypothetical protein ACD_62C00600G0006 [uncultured bacterium]HLD45769.1 hypothetical protein [bacterium]
MKTKSTCALLLVFAQLLFVSCAARNNLASEFVYHQNQQVRVGLNSSRATQAQEHYQPEIDGADFDSFDDKAGAVLIGLLGVGLTVSAIVIPIVLLNR